MKRAQVIFSRIAALCALVVLISVCVGLLYAASACPGAVRVCEWIVFVAALLGLVLYAIGEVMA